MKTIKTVSGMTYAVTTTVDCTVTTPEGVLIATCRAGEQTLFVAPAAAVLLSDVGAVVTASFNGASAGSASGGGVSEKKVAEMVAEAVVETTVTPFVDADYAWKAPIHWAQIDGSTVGSGVGSRVEIPCLTREGEPELSTGELYLELYEADEAGNFVLLGVSRNAVRQQAGQVSRWVFSDVAVHGRPIRLSPTRYAAGGWDDSLVLGAGGRPRYGQEDSFVELAAGGRSAVMLAVTISTVTHAARFAPAVHATDEVRHITAAERTSWSAKVEAGAPINATQLIDPSNDQPVFVTSSEGLGYLAPPALGATCLSLTEGGHLGLPFVLITSPSAEVCMEPHQLRMFYGSQVFRLGGENGRITCGLSQKDATVEDVSESLEAVLQAPGRVTRHVDDDVKHVTAAERARWESAAGGTLAANSTIADEGTGLASLNLRSDNAATLHVQRMETGNTRNAIALSVNNQLSKLDVWGAAAGIEVSNKAAPGETPTARCRITATTSTPGLKLDDMPLMMTFGETSLTLDKETLQSLAALIARKDELLALLQQPTKEI